MITWFGARPRPLCLAAAMIGLALVAVDCTGGGTPTSSTSPAGVPAFQRVLARIGDDGTIDRDTALQAFALAFGPLPGVHVPAGPAEEIPSGSGPLRWVLGQFARLTQAQRTAVLAAVGKPSGTPIGKPVARADGLTLVANTEQAQFEALVNQARAYYASRLPAAGLVVPDPAYFVTLNSRDVYGANAYTFAVDASGGESGPVDQCQIYFNPKVRRAGDAARREAAFHEVFHCFQARMVANLSQFSALSANGKGPGAWLVEGGALWAGDEGAGAAPIAARWWKTYFATPTEPLFKRTYDATGFFSHLEESGSDVYATFPAAMQAIGGGNVAAFGALAGGGGPDRFFASWPTGLLRQPALGPEWDTHGPGITADAVVPADVAAADGAAAQSQVLAYANDDRRLAVTAEVLLVGTGQYSRMRALGGGFDSSTPSDIYCTKGAACTCPQGSPQEGVTFRPLQAGAYYLALGGGPSGNSWTVAAYSLADYCRQPRTDNCLLGTWKLVSPPTLPGRVSLQRIDETMTATQDGTLTLAVDIAGSQPAGDGVTVAAELKGSSTVRAVAIRGIIQPRSVDFSGLQASMTLNGAPFFSFPLSQLFPGIQQDLTPVAYRCGPGTLTLTSITGRQWGFAKA